MYYNAYDPDRQKWIVGLATSKDGFVWRKQGPIFDGGPKSEFDSHGVISHRVVRDFESKRWIIKELFHCHDRCKAPTYENDSKEHFEELSSEICCKVKGTYLL